MVQAAVALRTREASAYVRDQLRQSRAAVGTHRAFQALEVNSATEQILADYASNSQSTTTEEIDR